MGSVDAINNAWARLTFGEMQDEIMDVDLGMLYRYVRTKFSLASSSKSPLLRTKKPLSGRRGYTNFSSI